MAAVGLAIGLAMALCASFAKYKYELTAFCYNDCQSLLLSPFTFTQ